MSLLAARSNDSIQTNVSCVLFELPRDLYNEICSSWLCLKDLGKVDCAVSHNSGYRVLWYEVLGSRTALSNHLVEVWNLIKGSNTILFMDWIYVRNLKLSKVVLDKECFSGDLNVLQCRIRYCDVQELIVKGVSHDVSEVVNACTNLTSFYIDRCDGTVNNLCPAVLNQLTYLKLSISEAPYDHIRLHCRKLECLMVYGPSVGVETITDIIVANPNLNIVNVKGEESVLEAILEHCKSLSRICFRMDSLPAALIRKFQLRISKLREFTVQFNDNMVSIQIYNNSERQLIVDVKNWEPQYDFLFQLLEIEVLTLMNANSAVVEEFARCNQAYLKRIRIVDSCVTLEMLEYFLKLPHILCVILLGSGKFDGSAVANLFAKVPSVIKVCQLHLIPFSLNDLINIIKHAISLKTLAVLGCNSGDVSREVLTQFLDDLKCSGRPVEVVV